MKALIAMSGGVDSSIAAYLMKKAGWDCIGATMKLFSNEEAGLAEGHVCCSLSDVFDARSVANRLQIPYFVFNFQDDFRRCVIDEFVRSYLNGLTPNPCIECNRRLKFGRLLRRAEELGCDCVATGHYARIEKSCGRHLLKKGLDESKDQSYVLCTLTQKQLAMLNFPLGAMKKSEVRAMAAQLGFVNAKKHDSQDICFAPDGDYAKTIERIRGCVLPRGKFTDADGCELGKHRGLARYTIGQRKGLGLSFGEPRYVVALHPEENTVVLGAEKELWSRTLLAANFNWIAGQAPAERLRLKVKIRYRQPEQWAEVEPLGTDKVRLVFDEPQRAAAPGQYAVLYDGDCVAGGGVICRQI